MSDLIDRQPEKRTEKRAETHACDCISRAAAINFFLEKGMITAAVYVDRLPSAQPERKKGKWILQIRYDNKGEPLLAWYQCSECGAFIANNEANFCSECGADMRETWEVKK